MILPDICVLLGLLLDTILQILHPRISPTPPDGVCHRKQETRAFYVYTEVSLDQLRMITMGIGKVGDLNTKTEIEKDIVESRTCWKKNSHPPKEHRKPKSSRSLL